MKQEIKTSVLNTKRLIAHYIGLSTISSRHMGSDELSYCPLYRAVYLKAIKVLKTRKSEMLSPIISGCLRDVIAYDLDHIGEGYRPLYRAVY